MRLVERYRKLSLSQRIYFSTACGFAIGMFFGVRCEVLSSFNLMFIKLFQVTIIPFMIFSIIQSIASLNSVNAKLISKKGGLILLLMWSVSLFFVFGLNFTFPDILTSKFFRPFAPLPVDPSKLIDLFIPSNPFFSLANGYIPAIVIFSILAGIALIEEKKKNVIIDYAIIFSHIMRRMNDYIITLLPLGVLVMSSYTFGTLNFNQFKGLLLYVFGSLFFLLFMSLIVYPVIMYSFTGMSYKKFIEYSFSAGIIAFTTGSVFLALPVIYDLMYKFDEESKGYCQLKDKESDERRILINIIVPLAWVVPASYKFLVIFFIIFAHWYYNLTLPLIEKLSFYILGIPCLFGSNAVIVPFLLQFTQLPQKAYNVFMIISSFLVYFNNANGAMFIVTSTMLCYISIKRQLKFRFFTFVGLIICCAIIFSAGIIGLKLLMTKILSTGDRVREELSHMNLHSYNQNYYGEIKAHYKTLDEYDNIPFLDGNESAIDRILRTGIMQVGYNPQAVPFSFFNYQNQIVGYDIDFIYDIAHNLGCKDIHFYSVYNLQQFQDAVGKGVCLDVCLGPYAYSPYRIKNIMTSDPYMRITPAVVLPSDLKDRYKSLEDVIHDKSITIGYLRGSNMVGIDKLISKERTLVQIQDYRDFYVKHEIDAFISTAEIASAINILYPNFWVYYYTKDDIELYYAYILPSDERYNSLVRAINTWITVCWRNGNAQKRFSYWIEGDTNMHLSRPWCLLDWIEGDQYKLIEIEPKYLKPRQF